MELTVREFLTIAHGMGFGALYLLACSGALIELWRSRAPAAESPTTAGNEHFLRAYLIAMAVLAWVTVLSGTYLIYPWYRMAPPTGTENLAPYPQHLLMSNPLTAGWHSIGMEWKEYIAWVVPLSTTMAAATVYRYGRDLRHQGSLRNTLLAFVAVSFLAASIAGLFGAMLAKHAPVSGGPTIHLWRGEPS